MPHPIFAPRINNNDDMVTITRIVAGIGDFLRAGDLVLEVETDKAVVAVETEHEGFVIGVCCDAGKQVAVGAVVVWLGARADDVVPAIAPALPGADAAAAITGKARLLLARHGLRLEAVPRSGPRLTAADVEAYVAAHRSTLPGAAAARADAADLAAEADQFPLSAAARGTLATVTWQRDHAAAAYLEFDYDPAPWRDYALAFGRDRRLLLNPLLALMAHRLALLGPALDVNGTVLEGTAPQRVRYRQVNLGFTVQAGERLYLCVVEHAEQYDAAGFVARLGELQRRAMAHRLSPPETRGATIGLTSMARWGVRRHMPVLTPHTAVMVAHGDAADAAHATLGITYDHRLLSGFDAVRLLRLLAHPTRPLPETHAHAAVP